MEELGHELAQFVHIISTFLINHPWWSIFIILCFTPPSNRSVNTSNDKKNDQ